MCFVNPIYNSGKEEDNFGFDELDFEDLKDDSINNSTNNTKAEPNQQAKDNNRQQTN